MPYPRYEDLPDINQEFLEGEGAGQRGNFFSRFNARSNNDLRLGMDVFQDYLRKYEGAVGDVSRSGGEATQSWTDFLDQNFNYARDFLRAPVEQSGRQTRDLSGPARYLFNF